MLEQLSRTWARQRSDAPVLFFLEHFYCRQFGRVAHLPNCENLVPTCSSYSLPHSFAREHVHRGCGSLCRDVCPRGMQGLFPPRRGRQSEACGGDHCHVHPHRFRTASGLCLCPRSSSCPCNPRATYTGVVFSRLCYCSVQCLWSKYYNILQRATTRRNITQHVAACYNSIAIVIGGVLFRRGG